MSPAAAAFLRVAGPTSTVVVNDALPITVTAYDAYGNIATNYTGTLVSSEPLINNYTFNTGSGNDNGVHTFFVPFDTVGSQNITVNDIADPAIAGGGSFVVNPGTVDLSQSNVAVSPGSIAVGSAITVVLTARDALGNQESSGGLTVTFGLTAGSSGGTFSDFTDDGDGIYTALFTAGTTPGSYAITATIGGQAVTSSPATVTVRANTTQVVSFTPTNFGFTATFDRPLDVATLHLYDSQGGALGAPDVTVIGATTGPVHGSLVLNAADTQITFIATSTFNETTGTITGGVLAPDVYTVTLLSSANGFQDQSGNLLDGAGNGTPGSNYVKIMTVAAPAANAVVVGIPDFARGYGQTVNEPAAATTGIPLTLSNGDGITSVSLDLHYNPALLDITGATVGTGLPAGASVTLDTTTTAGVATVTFSSPTALSAGALTFVNLQANVPVTATYAAKEILDLQNIVINGGAVPALDEAGIHIAAFFGDTNGNQRNDAADVSLLQKTLVSLNSGFSLYALLDPVIITDVSLQGRLASNDAALLQKVRVDLPVPNVPALPTGISNPPPTGLDPKMFIPTNLAGSVGQTVTVPVDLTVTEASGITVGATDVEISYDASKFSVANVQLGTLLSQGGFTFTANTSTPGQILITASSSSGTATLADNTTGSLFTIAFTVLAGAASGPSPINLLHDLNGNLTDLFDDNDNQLTLTPAPTNAGNDAIDGIFTISTNAAPAITSANNATFTAGTAGSFTVTTTGAPTATLTETGNALPSGVTFQDNGNGTATLAGTASAAGSFTITILATNGIAPDATQTFTLNVVQNTQPLTITTTTLPTYFTQGQTYNATITTSGGVTPIVFSVTAGTLPAGLTLAPSTGVISGTPTAYGTSTFTVQAQGASGVPAALGPTRSSSCRPNSSTIRPPTRWPSPSLPPIRTSLSRR